MRSPFVGAVGRHGSKSVSADPTANLRLLDRRFGSIDATTRRRVKSADADRLLEWSDRILTGERLGDVFGD